MKRKELFLKWCVSTFMVSVLIGLAIWLNWSQSAGLNMIGKGIVLVVFYLMVKAMINAGAICWAVDKALDSIEPHSQGTLPVIKRDLRRLRHQADHISFAAHIAPFYGLLGFAGGIWSISRAGLTGLDAAHVQQVSQQLQVGVGLAFLPTIIGVVCLIVLSTMHHRILHRIAYTLEDL